MVAFVLKIPLPPPFPKGEVKDIFILFYEPMTRVVSTKVGIQKKEMDSCFHRNDSKSTVTKYLDSMQSCQVSFIKIYESAN
jgi:hypothetical protein